MKRCCTCKPCIKNKHIEKSITLQHAGMSFFWLTSRFTIILLRDRHALNQNFGPEWERDPLLEAFHFFSTFPWSPFLIFLISYWACFQLKNCRKSIVMIGNSFHEVDKCSWRNLNFWRFLNLFLAPLTQSLRPGYHWKDLFLWNEFEHRWCQF